MFRHSILDLTSLNPAMTLFILEGSEDIVDVHVIFGHVLVDDFPDVLTIVVHCNEILSFKVLLFSLLVFEDELRIHTRSGRVLDLFLNEE